MSEPTDQHTDLPAARPNAALTADVVALLRTGGEDRVLLVLKHRLPL